jgi:hypothetical protein
MSGVQIDGFRWWDEYAAEYEINVADYDQSDVFEKAQHFEYMEDRLERIIPRPIRKPAKRRLRKLKHQGRVTV